MREVATILFMFLSCMCAGQGLFLVSPSGTCASDCLRWALSTSLSAYNSASDTSWVKITATEYEKLKTLQGAARAGLTDAQFSNTMGSSTPEGHTLATAINTTGSSDYIYAIGLKYYNGDTYSGVKIKKSESISSNYHKYGSTLPNVSTSTFESVFYVLKNASYQTSAPTYIGIYNGTASSYTQSIRNCSASNGKYKSGDVHNPDTNDSGGKNYCIQALTTNIKTW